MAASLTGDPEGRKFQPQVGHTTFVAIGHEIISTAIVPLPLIEEGQ